MDEGVLSHSKEEVSVYLAEYRQLVPMQFPLARSLPITLNKRQLPNSWDFIYKTLLQPGGIVYTQTVGSGHSFKQLTLEICIRSRDNETSCKIRHLLSGLDQPNINSDQMTSERTVIISSDRLQTGIRDEIQTTKRTHLDAVDNRLLLALEVPKEGLLGVNALGGFDDNESTSTDVEHLLKEEEALGQCINDEKTHFNRIRKRLDISC